MNSLRIIYYSPHPTHDIVSTVGYSVHQRETINAFRKLGHNVLPIIMGGMDEKKVALKTDELYKKASSLSKIKKILPLSIWNALKDIQLLFHDRKAGKILEKAILEFKPDLIYERGEYLQDSGVKVAKRYKIKHVLEVNSPVVEEMAAFEGPDLFRFLGHYKEKRKLRDTTQVITVSTALKNFLREYYNCDKNILVTPNAINPDKDLPEDIAVNEIKKEIAPHAKIVGFVGSILPYHGVDKLIEAFSRVVKTQSNIHLLIVGEGAIRQSMEELATKLLPAHSFTFAGKIPHSEVMNYIKAFDIAVMASSNWYGSPVKIFEYGWMGVPIIAPDNIPLRDVMENEKDGLLVSDNIIELEMAILYMVNNIDESKLMGERFQYKVKQDYTWDAQTKRILESLIFL